MTIKKDNSEHCQRIGRVLRVLRCHYTKSNPIDDHSNISSKRLQKQNFKPLGHYTCVQCGTSHLLTVQENILSRIILATYRKFTVTTVRFTQNVSCNIFTHPYINKWQMSLCNNSSDNKRYWIHRVDVKVSAQVTAVTYMHQSQPSSHLLRINLTLHLEVWPGNHLIWCNATLIGMLSIYINITSARRDETKAFRFHCCF